MCWSSCAVERRAGRPASALVKSRPHRRLSAGTDGYPLKPFNLCELSVRIEAGVATGDLRMRDANGTDARR
ncbi:hypothetical protein EGJ42_14830 [Stutzerimonas stutzeri]|nr:hypothetical protein EGJ42_14830 [Stutzerimonas stutzeri]